MKKIRKLVLKTSWSKSTKIVWHLGMDNSPVIRENRKWRVILQQIFLHDAQKFQKQTNTDEGMRTLAPCFAIQNSIKTLALPPIHSIKFLEPIPVPILNPNERFMGS